MKRNTEILMIVQYPEKVSPAQRFRFELYKDLLQKNGYNITTRSFLDEKGYEVIHQYGFFFRKFIAILKGFCKRLLLLFNLKKYDFILLQREATPVGPPVFEWFVTRVFKKKLIYDFDDAIWLRIVSKQNSVATIVKNTGKVKKICKWAYKVSCGNQYLCNYAARYNPNVIFNPTCVDTINKHNIITNHDTGRISIGWTGSFSTMTYLQIVQPALQLLQKKYDFDIKIICNQEPVLDLKNVTYIKWSEENEVPALATCQIGLMPLTYEEWNEGKCGFKLIQYLALEIPAVSSPVGVNKIIIEEGVNGFFARNDAEWYTAIEKLILDPSLRKRMGAEGRKKITAHYSLQSNEQNFLSLFGPPEHTWGGSVPLQSVENQY
jgi:glycosyltransferase involved in cell wall biosynthesis